jgi:hypothetical protein
VRAAGRSETPLHDPDAASAAPAGAGAKIASVAETRARPRVVSKAVVRFGAIPDGIGVRARVRNFD